MRECWRASARHSPDAVSAWSADLSFLGPVVTWNPQAARTSEYLRKRGTNRASTKAPLARMLVGVEE
jgi:hypothetical protein